MIVVATNGQPESSSAVQWAAAEAVRRACPLRVLVAVSVPTALTGAFADPTALPDEVVDSARAVADQAAAAAREAGVADVGTSVRIGTAAAVLVAESQSADLVVLGSRGRGEIASALLGSVSVTVSAHARCPVVVVRPDTHPRLEAGHPVLAGVDGSPRSRHTAAFAADVAARAGAPLILVSAWQVPVVGLTSLEYWALVDADQAAVFAEAAGQVVAQARDEVLAAHPDLSVQTLVVEAEAGVALVEHSADASLLVVGSRGHGGFTGLLLGSVSHHVLHDARCPVAVVR
ncbi:MAG: universal stress protein [Dermatophilaceae bacterium]